HGRCGPARGAEQAALSLAHRRDEVHHPSAIFLWIVLEVDPLLRIERREIVKENFIAGRFGIFEVDLLNLEKREIALAFLWRPDLSRDDVSGSEIESTDLGRRDIDIVWPWK